MRISTDDGRPGGAGSWEGDGWDALVVRIMKAAGPELDRLRARTTVVGQFGAWTRPLLPMAAVLMVAFGSLLAWVGEGEANPVSEAPLMAEVLMPDPLVLWVEAGVGLTLEEVVSALEGGEG